VSTPWPPPPGPSYVRAPQGLVEVTAHERARAAVAQAQLDSLRRPLRVVPPSAPLLRPRRVWRDFDTAAARWAAPWWALTWLLTLGRSGRLPWTWETPTPEQAHQEAELERERFHGCSCGRVCAGSPAVRGRRITAWKACPAPLCSRQVWANGPGELRTSNLGTR
jgi:hypothetical protein